MVSPAAAPDRAPDAGAMVPPKQALTHSNGKVSHLMSLARINLSIACDLSL